MELSINSWFIEKLKFTICFRKRLQFFEFPTDKFKK